MFVLIVKEVDGVWYSDFYDICLADASFIAICGKLPGILCDSLLCAVLRVAVSASSFRHIRELGPVLDARPGDGRTLALSKILPYVPKEMSVKKGELPLRYAFDLYLIFFKSKWHMLNMFIYVICLLCKGALK